jgi:hypothetical protein
MACVAEASAGFTLFISPLLLLISGSKKAFLKANCFARISMGYFHSNENTHEFKLIRLFNATVPECCVARSKPLSKITEVRVDRKNLKKITNTVPEYSIFS